MEKLKRISDKIIATLRKWHCYFSERLERNLSGTKFVTEYVSLPDLNTYFSKVGLDVILILDYDWMLGFKWEFLAPEWIGMCSSVK